MYEANHEVTTTYRTIKQIQVEEYARAISDVIALLEREEFTEHAGIVRNAALSGELKSPFLDEFERVTK